MAKRAEKIDPNVCPNPTCRRYRSDHTTRESKACRAAIRGDDIETAIPDTPTPEPDPPAEKFETFTGKGGRFSPEARAAQAAAAKETRVFDIPEHVRTGFNEAKRFRRSGEPVPQDIIELEREYKRLRWEQLPADQRKTETDATHERRLAVTVAAVDPTLDPAVVRAWAVEQGLPIMGRGRLSRATVEKYLAAHHDHDHDPEPEVEVEPESAPPSLTAADIRRVREQLVPAAHGEPLRKRYRVGYFVAVEIDAFDAGEAALIGRVVCKWPRERRDTPRVVLGEFEGKSFQAAIVESTALMATEVTGA